MSFEEAELLRERSMLFLEEAKKLYGERKYDLAAFMLEQSIQLYLKYLLLVKVGTYPRTHSLSRLLQELEGIFPEAREIRREYAVELGAIEDAYIMSRYMPRRYSREEIERFMQVVEKVVGRLRHGR